MAEHSVLGASSAHRWVNCPGSVQATQDLPDESSVYAEEGTRAHALCAYTLGQLVGVEQPKPEFEYDEDTKTLAENYARFVMEKVTPSATVLIEQRVDYTEYVNVPAFGTADCIIMDDGVMHIIDYKHGQGVPVSVEDNDQLELYALGAYQLLGPLYEIDTVRLSIYQPRIHNIATWEISLDDLCRKAEQVFKPKALEAMSEDPGFASGDWCRFCKLSGSCRVRAAEQLKIAQAEFGVAFKENGAQMDDKEMGWLLGQLDGIIQWANSVKDYALAQAKGGRAIPGWKLVYGRSVRKYTDEAKVAEAVKAVGLDPYEHKVLGVTAMEKLLGKKRFSEVLGDLVHKPLGKETLVPESDQRPAIAEEDFSKLD